MIEIVRKPYQTPNPAKPEPIRQEFFHAKMQSRKEHAKYFSLRKLCVLAAREFSLSIEQRFYSIKTKFLKLFVIWIFMIFTLQWFFCNERSVSPQIDYEPELNVFALLILNNQQKIVRVEHSYRIEEYMPESEGITNAQVTIRSDSQTVQFEHAGEGNYRDAGNSLLLIPGTTYHLEVEVPDGRELTGSCIMPAKPEIINPKFYEEVPAHKALNVMWYKADFAHRYLCILSDLEKDFTP